MYIIAYPHGIVSQDTRDTVPIPGSYTGSHTCKYVCMYIIAYSLEIVSQDTRDTVPIPGLYWDLYMQVCMYVCHSLPPWKSISGYLGYCADPKIVLGLIHVSI